MARQKFNGDPRPVVHQDVGAPDPEQIIVQHLFEWLRRRCQKTLPAPAPATPSQAAEWWLTTMQEPEQQGETRLVPLGGVQEGQRWETGYANRCAFAFLRWADLPKMEREAVCAGVMGDGVPYRGDDFAFYRLVIDGAYEMREIGLEEYREIGNRKMREAKTRVAMRARR